MIVDCSDCKVRNIACADCVVTVLLGAPGWGVSEGVRVGSKPEKIALDQDELGAMTVLADSGLVPRLRLVVGDETGDAEGSLPSRDIGGDQRAG